MRVVGPTADERTIDSQVAALRNRVTDEALLLSAEREFPDEGYSGATLVRPSAIDLCWMYWPVSRRVLFIPLR